MEEMCGRLLRSWRAGGAVAGHGRAGVYPTAVPALGSAGCSDGAKPLVSTHSPCLKRGNPDAIGRSHPVVRQQAVEGAFWFLVGSWHSSPKGRSPQWTNPSGWHPVFGKSLIPPLYPIHRKTVPLVLT